MTRGRGLERRAKRRLYRGLTYLYRCLAPTHVPRGPVPPSALRRVLVIPNDAVGDVVVATSALAYLRAVAPHARIDVLSSSRQHTLLDGDPRVDRVLVYDLTAVGWVRRGLALRRERYDLIVDCTIGHHLRAGIFSALVAGRHAARATPYRPPQFHGLFTHVSRLPGFERRHMAERWLHAAQHATRDGPRCAAAEIARYPMALAANAAADARAAHFWAARLQGRAFVAVNCWTTDDRRTLGAEQAAHIVAGLAAAHPALAFVLTPPPAAAPDPETIAEAARARLRATEAGRILVLPPTPSLHDLVAVLRLAAVVVTPDTANVHLASGTGRPVVALYARHASDQIARWTPSGVPHRVVVLEGRRPLRDLAPGRVIAAFDALWAEIACPPPHARRAPGAVPAITGA